VSARPTRALVGLVTAVAALALPAAASAAESASVTLSGTQAGSNPQITQSVTFAGNGDTPKTVVLSEASGLAANLNANPSCITGAQNPTSGCQVGTVTVTTNSSNPDFDSVSGAVYLVPPASGSGDFAGLESVASPFPNQYSGLSLRTTPTVGVDVTTNLIDTRSTSGLAILGLSLTLNPTLNNAPFTALPTSCATATSTTSITYYGGTASTNPSASFTPTGCSNLKYAPKVTAAITRDKGDTGASVVLTQTQTVGESASKTIVLTLPKGLTPNVIADAPCLTGSGAGCQVGTAVATSPGVPNAALANGVMTLSGSLTTPLISVSFPKPFALTDVGQVNLAAGTVTFADVPDLPLTSLALNVTGPNGQKAFNTDCAPASVGGQFTGQNGATATVSAPIKFTNCPTASGSTSGLASGHPRLNFKVGAGKGAPNLTSVAIGLASGLRFSHAAFANHKTCTPAQGQGKKKCTTTTLITGLGVTGAKVKSAAIKGGKLVITFKKAAASATITVTGPLVTETSGLQQSVKKHKVKSLTFSLKTTDAGKTATMLPLKLAAH
jgi:hypothetical protein